MAMMSIANQTRKPDHFTIYDDNDPPKDIRTIEMCLYMLRLLDIKGIPWDIVYGAKKGQHWNHQGANRAGFDAVFRLDDDCYAEPDVLEKLEAQMVEGVGAVGCSVLTPPLFDYVAPASLIANMRTPNKQWVPIKETEGVDHLHCAFLYRAGIVDYDLRLSVKAHREETMFTYALKCAGYKILVTPGTIWHFRSQGGGIRTDNNEQDYRHDEEIFQNWLGFTKSEDFLVVLDNGMGDHVVFKKAVLPKLKEKHQNIVIACCYPALFPDEKTISIADAQRMVDIRRYDIYEVGVQSNWGGNIASLYEKVYGLR